MGGEYGMAAEIDAAQKNGKDLNPRLLDPSVTPEKLRSIPFAIACPCPTRTMTRETGMSLANLVKPMFGNAIPISPDSMEVGEARNQCVEIAKQAGAEYIFFVDYDVAVPANALVKLLSLKVDVAAGVYHLKQVPSYPLIYVQGWQQAFEDYEYGDLIKADGVGMGCTLIKMSVFDKLEPPYFKTVPGYVEGNPNAVLPHMTEDIYFCQKAKAAGFDIIVDTSIQCGHVDWRTGVIYRGEPDASGKSKRIAPSWIYRRNGQYIVETVPDANHPGLRWATTKPPVEAAITKLDLGCGAVPAEGHTGIDMYDVGPNIINGDAADLGWFRQEHGLVESIRASHFLEHIGHRDVGRTVRDWASTLLPGGTMHIVVPDLEYHTKRLVEAIDEGTDRSPDADYWIATIYGWQIADGHVHLNGFTENRLRQLMVGSGLVDIEITKNVNPGSPSGEIAENGELVLTARRPGESSKKRKRAGGE